MIKTRLEAQVIQFSNLISSRAHIEVMKKIRPGMKEYQLEAIFKQYAYYYVSGRDDAAAQGALGGWQGRSG